MSKFGNLEDFNKLAHLSKSTRAIMTTKYETEFGTIYLPRKSHPLYEDAKYTLCPSPLTGFDSVAFATFAMNHPGHEAVRFVLNETRCLIWVLRDVINVVQKGLTGAERNLFHRLVKTLNVVEIATFSNRMNVTLTNVAELEFLLNFVLTNYRGIEAFRPVVPNFQTIKDQIKGLYRYEFDRLIELSRFLITDNAQFSLKVATVFPYLSSKSQLAYLEYPLQHFNKDRFIKVLRCNGQDLIDQNFMKNSSAFHLALSRCNDTLSAIIKSGLMNTSISHSTEEYTAVLKLLDRENIMKLFLLSEYKRPGFHLNFRKAIENQLMKHFPHDTEFLKFVNYPYVKMTKVSFFLYKHLSRKMVADIDAGLGAFVFKAIYLLEWFFQGHETIPELVKVPHSDFRIAFESICHYKKIPMTSFLKLAHSLRKNVKIHVLAKNLHLLSFNGTIDTDYQETFDLLKKKEKELKEKMRIERETIIERLQYYVQNRTNNNNQRPQRTPFRQNGRMNDGLTVMQLILSSRDASSVE
jgi:hypothetical protein